MFSTKLKLLLSILAILSLINTYAFASDETKKDIPLRIENADQALKRAIQFTGFDKSKTYTAERAEDIAILTKIIDSTTPSIRDTINSKSVWLVSFADIQLQSPDDPKLNNRYPKDFDVILDPETGNLLKITSSFLEFEPNRQYDYPPEMKVDDPTGLQSFYGFPSELPILSFYDVVKALNSLGVKHISATYIKQFHPVYGDKGYWCVTYRGIVGPKSRVKIETRIIDPESGKMVAVKGERAGSLFGD